MGEERAMSVGYCGLVCSVCSHAAEDCAGCREGGGDAHCEQRACCVQRNLVGCWDCNEFPCRKGYYGDEAWRGLNLAFAQTIRERGVATLMAQVSSMLGDPVEYGDYRFRAPEEIVALLESRDG